jgi:hypothetical protein
VAAKLHEHSGGGGIIDLASLTVRERSLQPSETREVEHLPHRLSPIPRFTVATPQSCSCVGHGSQPIHRAHSTCWPHYFACLRRPSHHRGRQSSAPAVAHRRTAAPQLVLPAGRPYHPNHPCTPAAYHMPNVRTCCSYSLWRVV